MIDEAHRGDRSAGEPDHSQFSGGATCGVGSLPHRDAAAAAAFAVGEFDIATIPTLSTGSATSTDVMIDQAIAGRSGFVRGPEGLTVDGDPDVVPVAGLLDRPAGPFAGLHAFLDLAPKVRLDGTPVTWQLVGPVTLGLALLQGGAPDAFALAAGLVREHLEAVATTVAGVLPSSPQLVVLDEPALGELMAPDFPLPPDEAIDLVSGAMAVLSSRATVGLHCCTGADVASLLATGPAVLSVPAAPELVQWAGYLGRFLADGGVVAWGAIPIDGPVGGSADRHWRSLSDLWCSLVQLGCDPVTLRTQSLVTPACGLAPHTVAVARRLARQTSAVARRVKDQAGATRFALGA